MTFTKHDTSTFGTLALEHYMCMYSLSARDTQTKIGRRGC